MKSRFLHTVSLSLPVLLFVVAIALPYAVYGAQLMNPLGEGSTLIGLLRDLLNAVIILMIPIVVFFIIYAGFLYVTARGNTETVTKAHRALLYAVIGGVIILGANVIIEVIQGTVESITVQ